MPALIIERNLILIPGPVMHRSLAKTAKAAPSGEEMSPERGISARLSRSGFHRVRRVSE